MRFWRAWVARHRPTIDDVEKMLNAISPFTSGFLCAVVILTMSWFFCILTLAIEIPLWLVHGFVRSWNVDKQKSVKDAMEALQ